MPAIVQDKNIWILADTGSCRNLISENFWNSLPLHSQLAPPGATIVVAGDGNVLQLVGWAILKLEILGKQLYHEVGIVKDLPVNFLLGGELMTPHACTLQYVPNARNTLTLGNVECTICKENKETLKDAQSPLLFTNFRHIPLPKIRPIAAAALDSEIVPTEIDQSNLIRHRKLEKVLSELKISELKISQSLKHSLVALIDRCLDAFAASDDDIGHTSIVEHTIDTGSNPPVREKLRPLPYSSIEFVDHEIDHFLEL